MRFWQHRKCWPGGGAGGKRVDIWNRQSEVLAGRQINRSRERRVIQVCTLKTYFLLFGILLTAYAIVRVAIWWELRGVWKLPPSRPRKDSGEPGTPIDTSKLTGRVDELRQLGYANEAKTGDAFKKPLWVEEKRRQMEKMAYFQKPPPEPEPPEPEHGGGVSLMLI